MTQQSKGTAQPAVRVTPAWARIHFFAAIFVLAGATLQAQPAPLRVLASNVVKAGIERLLPEFERTSGLRLEITWGASAEFKRRLDAGEPFDYAILTGATMDALVREGRITQPILELGRVPYAVGIHAQAAKADITTPEKLKQRLLAAKSLTYSKDGSGVALFERMFASLGITAEMRAKTVPQENAGRGGESVATGEFELSLAPASEIAGHEGAAILGHLPAEFQSPVRVAAAALATSSQQNETARLADFLSKPTTRAALEKSGISPR